MKNDFDNLSLWHSGKNSKDARISCTEYIASNLQHLKCSAVKLLIHISHKINTSRPFCFI